MVSFVKVSEVKYIFMAVNKILFRNFPYFLFDLG
jgi:hypothetical protein